MVSKSKSMQNELVGSLFHFFPYNRASLDQINIFLRRSTLFLLYHGRVKVVDLQDPVTFGDQLNTLSQN